MSPARFAVHRPVTTLMACIITALLGWVALSELSVDLMPDMEFPTVTVSTLYPGAGPEEVETLITRPLEQVLSSVNGFERLSSRSIEGSSSIRVQFQWGANLDAAVDEMRQAVDKVRRDLPEGIDPPSMRRYDANDRPILYLGLNSDLPATEVTRLAETSIFPRLERLDGVARVGMRGHVRREIHVEINRARLDSLQMGVNEVVTALESGNVSRPAGDFEEGHLHRLIRSRSEFQSLEEIRNLVVRRTGDSVIRVRDIAEVADSHERITQRTRVNGRPGIMLYVFKQAGANTIDVSDNVHAAVERINRELRHATLVVRMDRSDFIRNSITNLQQAALFGMALAMAVLVLFLRSFRSTFIIGVSMPLSVLAAFILIYFRGYTLNMVSFGGLALGIGMLVDNSIVVLESIFRKRDEGLDAKEAAVEGTNEVASAITASTLTTMIVFLPLAFVTGLTAVLLHQLAFVVCISMVCSLFASLTLTPALAAYWLGNSGLSHEARLEKGTGARSSRLRRAIRIPSQILHALSGTAFRFVEGIYDRFITRTLRHAGLAAALLLFLFCATLGLIPRIGTDFLPQTDDGRMGITGTMAPGIQLETLDRQSVLMEHALAELVPEIETTSAFIGDDADDGDDWNRARIILQLVPRNQRDDDAEGIRRRIAENLPPVAGMSIRGRVYGGLPVSRMFRNDGDNLAVLVRGHHRGTAEDLAEAVAEIMKSVPGIVNVELQTDDVRPELTTRIDRAKASQMGVTVQHISQALETTFRGTHATVFRDDGDEYNVLVRLRQQDRTGSTDLDQIGVTTSSGRLVPLGNLVSYEMDNAPLGIDRVDRQRVLTVTGSAEGRDLGNTIGELQRQLATVPVPEGFQLEIAGDWEDQQKSFQALTRGFLLAVLLMYMVMAAQFESLRDPLLIMVTLPLAAIGVILVLVFWDMTLNVQSFIGLIVLAGVVVNNAIVLVDYANRLRRQRGWTFHADGGERRPAALEIVRRAAVRRFRPIVMTTLTTVLGMLPVALGWGEGGELQAPMARVVIGGLLSGTIITLVAIPLILKAALSADDPAEDAPSAVRQEPEPEPAAV